MKLEFMIKFIFLILIGLLVTTLEHEKSFMRQEVASTPKSIAVYGDSLLLTVYSDIVQKDIETGAIQRTFRAHMKTILTFAVTKDSRMVSSSEDDMIIFWNLETGSIMKRIWLRVSEASLLRLYVQDDQLFASGLDEKVRQIDSGSGRVVRTISLTGQVYCAAVGSDSLFVGKEFSPFIVKLSINSGTIILDLDGHSGPVHSLFLDDNLLFSGSADTSIIGWNAATGEIIRTYLGHSNVVYSVAVFDAELYSAAPGGELFKWSINDAVITTKFNVIHFYFAQTIAYKSHTLFTGSFTTTIFRWDTVSGDVLFSYNGRESIIWSLVSWKNLIISGGHDTKIRLWDASIDSVEPFAVFDNYFERIQVLHILEDHMYCAGNFRSIKQIQLPSIMLMSVALDSDLILSFASDMLSLYGGGAQGSIYQWNVSSGIQIAMLSAHSADIRSLKLDNEILYSGSWDNSIKTWNTKSLENFSIFAVYDLIYELSIEQESLIVCSSLTIELLHVISGERNVLVEEPSPCFCLVSNGNIVYTGHENGLIRVRNTFSLIPLETYVGHMDSIFALCFDSQFILYSAGNEGAIKKWSAASRSVAFSFENRNGSVSSLAVYQNQLLVGLKSGRIDFYNNSNALYLSSNEYHRRAVSSLIEFNGSVYSSGFDGNILKFSSPGDGNFTKIYKSDQEPMKDLTLRSFFWVGLQGDTKIVFNHFDLSPEL
ncbi:hypothetical protein MP638_000907, partial [Amoeboaphelidium occidentale]